MNDVTTSRGSRIRKAFVTPIEPAAIDFGQQMMRHVLLIEDRLAGRLELRQPLHHFAPIVFLRSNDFICSGVRHVRLSQIVGVEWFVTDQCVRTVAPRSHHRGRDVPWSGPHGDALHGASV